MGRNMKNFMITMAIITVMILGINWVLKDYIYYKRVTKDEDISSAERYLNAFPGGFYADEVEERYDEYSFQEAKTEGSAESYDTYINKFGRSGKYIEEAKTRYESLQFQELKNRANLEEIIRFAKRFPESKYEPELKKIEDKLWQQNKTAFNNYAQNNGYSSELRDKFNNIFDYMQENRFTRLYVGATLDKELLKDWNDYPSEVRLLWDDPVQLTKTFDQSIIVSSEEIEENNSSTIFPLRTEVPSEVPPSSIKGYIRRDQVRRLYKELPNLMKDELQKAILDFPILHTVRNPDEIPKDAPALVLTCRPSTREVQIGEYQSPVFSMMLRERKNQRRRTQEDQNENIKAQFNGYMLGIDVKWSLSIKQGQDISQEIYSASYAPESSTQFLSRSKLSKQYTKLIEETLDKFKKDLARKTVFDLSEKK